MLPPKFCSVDLPAPQRLPQLVFGVGRVASQRALALIVADFLPGLAFHGSLLFFLVMLVRWGNPSPPNPPLDGEGFDRLSFRTSPPTRPRTCRAKPTTLPAPPAARTRSGYATSVSARVVPGGRRI